MVLVIRSISLPLICFLASICLFKMHCYAGQIDIGVYYFPGWHSKSDYWNDLKGEPGSRSPGKAWEERYPLLGFYPEEETWVAEKHIEWASSYGIDFFAYDWYWDGKQPNLNHAIQAYLNTKNKSKLKFCIMWANHSEVPRNVEEFRDMIQFWSDHYFKEETYYRINEMPLVFIFSPSLFDSNSKRFKESAKKLILKANELVRGKGFKGIYFVAITNWMPRPELAKKFNEKGFSAYTGWNFAAVRTEKSLDYDTMVQTYLEYYEASKKTEEIIPYLIPVSPGHDSRPWHGEKAYVRENPTPEKFEGMLEGAKKLAVGKTKGPRIIMIMSWNEFAEGSYIEPTVKWNFKYLESIQRVLKPKEKD